MAKMKRNLVIFGYFCVNLNNSRPNKKPERMDKEVSLAQLTNIEKYSSQFSSLGENYLFSHVTEGKPFMAMENAPMRVSGIVILMTLKGNLELEVNLTSFKLRPKSLLVVGPDRLLQMKSVENQQLDAYILIISPDFIRDINLDMNVINLENFTPNPQPPLTLSEEESALMKRYFDLIHNNTRDNPDDIYVRSISRCLIAAAVYQLFQFTAKNRAESVGERAVSRRSNYVKDFMRLLQEFHRMERSVSFYASKLCISPKYLSLVIKEATGKSAADWIDEFVILEAKNLLRFSSKNVQQVAYELNFSNQSSFGKYFKHITGMSPTEYQRS